MSSKVTRSAYERMIQEDLEALKALPDTLERAHIEHVLHDSTRCYYGDEAGNQAEAFLLLDLIDAEFQSDPTSTQCFDLRIVERVKKCVHDWKLLEDDKARGNTAP